MNVHFEGCPASGGDPCTCASVLGVSKTRLLPDAVAFLDQIVKAIEDGPAHPRLTDAVVMVAALRRRLQNESTKLTLEAPALPHRERFAPMPWIKVDDHFDEHPKLSRVGPLGWALWLAGLAYCNRNLTDGFIPWAGARSLVSWEFLHVNGEGREIEYTVAATTGMHGENVTCRFVIDMLVDAGLWEEVDGGYRVHDFEDYQPSKLRVLEDRQKANQRQSRHRSQGKSQPESRRDIA